MHSTDTILLYPDGHHEFRVVSHANKYPPPILASTCPLPVDWENGTTPAAMPEILYFYKIGKATSKLTISGQGYQRKARVWFYGPENPAGLFRLDDLANLAEDFFATKRKSPCRKLLHF